jgi:hypothetical protein
MSEALQRPGRRQISSGFFCCFEESSEQKSIHLCRGHAVLAARLSDATESIIVGARFLTDGNTGDELKASHSVKDLPDIEFAERGKR